MIFFLKKLFAKNTAIYQQDTRRLLIFNTLKAIHRSITAD